MEKFSLFDLLSFAIPGSIALVLTYWGGLNAIPIRLNTLPMPDTLLIVVLLMLSYFVGHLINEAGMWLERRLGGMPTSWVTILTNQQDLAKRLNTIAQKVFDLSFLDEKGTVDPSISGQFYDHAFNALEVSGKLEKVRILQSQYVFLRNIVALACWGLIIFGVVFMTQLWAGGQSWSDTVPMVALSGIVFSIISAWLARRLSIKRRHMKMSATLHNFYAFYILENQFSK
jgi:hypothetical protein